jgi:transcriptional regulator with XRE-family HTH domain
MPSPSTFGDLLRQLRKRAGMTQGDLAAAVGYSVSFVCDLERNRRLPAVAVILQQFIPALGLQEEAGFATHLVELAARARRLLMECFAIRQVQGLLYATGNDPFNAYLFSGLAGLGEPGRAASVLGCAARILTTANSLQGRASEHSHYERILAGVRAQLDEVTFSAAYAEGYAMTPDQAVAFALTHFTESKPGA